MNLYSMDITFDENPWPDYVRRDKVLVAYCNSEPCNQKSIRYKEKNLKLGKIKKVNKFVDYCPDCGNALFWTKKGLERCLGNKRVSRERRKRT